MAQFQLPNDLKYNRGRIDDPGDYFKQSGCASWLYLVGEEFAAMEGGMSFKQVQEATDHSINVISDPPRQLTLELAKQHIAALDALPRPTMISCRTGPRASAVAYVYAGLKLGANAEDVIKAAENDEAPFTKTDEYKEWVRTAIEQLKPLAGDDTNSDTKSNLVK